MKVLVIGDACQDVYIYGACDRMCPDAPVPIFIPQHTIESGGMAKNVRSNIEALGAKVDIICNTEGIIKTRYVDAKTNHLFLRVDSNEESTCRFEGVKSIDLTVYDAIVVSDYNKGFLSPEDINFICQAHPLVFVDSKKVLKRWARNATFIKINEKEYDRSELYSSDTINYLHHKLIVTRSSLGCEYQGESFPVQRVPVKDSSGAGDPFLAGLVVSYLKTEDIRKAIQFANECATKVVQQRGVTTV